ncbi:MAG: hypothetical protein MHM6MM_007815 [Cercozoa sp. M6MM]
MMQRVNAHLREKELRGYLVNLDPAVLQVPYGANIDIRQTVDYKQVMEQYSLGPNGAIMTSLNLFATRFDQVIGFLERKQDELDYVFIDTPGQIEAFTWSASGQIITESLAAGFPTAVLYVCDTPRCTSPITFMSNMTYACSILYKTRLPFLVAFNKVDVAPSQKVQEWMGDLDAFDEALRGETTFMGSLTRSMALALDAFYESIQSVGVSAVTGMGFDDLFEKLVVARQEYCSHYLPWLLRRRQKQLEKERARIEDAKARFDEERRLEEAKLQGAVARSMELPQEHNKSA